MPDSPYGVVYYLGGNYPLSNIPQQVITDVQALVPTGGGYLRPQVRWNRIVTTTPTITNGLPSYPSTDSYDWSVVDDIMTRCNAANVNVIYCIQIPPVWRTTIDLAGNTVPFDGQTCQSPLHTAINTGGGAVTTIYVDIATGHSIAAGSEITIDYGVGGTAEALDVTGGPYSAGSAVAIGVTNPGGSNWIPKHPHAAGALVYNTGGQFPNATDTYNYVKVFLSRYNGSTTNFITHQAQTALTCQVIQFNEDYDTPGSNAQRDVQSKWFVTVWQTVGPLIRAHAPNMIIGGPAARRTSDDGHGGPYGLAHITAWTTNIFTYTPPGSTWAGALVDSQGNSILDFLDYHYYRDNVSDSDPAHPLPSPGGNTAPTHAQELLAIKQVANTQGYSNFDVWCTETGWTVSDDGSGITTTTSQQYTAGTAYTTLRLQTATTSAMADAAAITIDYGNVVASPFTDNQEVVYAYGAAAKGATTITITTNAQGSGAAQASWTPSVTHVSGATVYSSIIAVNSEANQATYITETYDQHRQNGGTHVIIWTDDPNSRAQVWKNPIFANDPKAVTRSEQSSPGGPYNYRRLAAFTAMKNYAALYPSWTNTVQSILEQANPATGTVSWLVNRLQNILEQANPATGSNTWIATFIENIRETANPLTGRGITLPLGPSVLFPTISRRTSQFAAAFRRTSQFPSTKRRG